MTDKLILTRDQVEIIGRSMHSADVYPFTGMDVDEGLDEIEAAECSVIHSYMPDGPSWTGDIYTLVWGECCWYTLVGIGSNGCRNWINEHNADQRLYLMEGKQ